MKLTYYVVSKIVRAGGVYVDPPGAEMELRMSWAEGMVGVMPVFITREAAVEYAGSDDCIVEFEEQSGGDP